VRNDKKTVFILPVTEDWPQTSNGFTRTIMVELPSAKQLACALDSPPVTKRHTLKLIMMVYTNVSDEKEAKELRVESKSHSSCSFGIFFLNDILNHGLYSVV
jgi:hypothetical protein